MKKVLVPMLAAAMVCAAAAQVPATPRNAPPPATPGNSTAAPMPNLLSSLAPLNRFVENARVDLAGLRIEKWKTNSDSKRQAQANVESLQRNMTAALPGMVQQVRANPYSVGASFKLYRNMNALYDVLSSLAETAGAFGAKEEYQALANDAANLDNLRRSMADEVGAMANSRDAQVAYLEGRLRQATAAATAAPPKKIVIDENQPEKKTAKKKVVKKKPAEKQPPAAPKSQ